LAKFDLSLSGQEQKSSKKFACLDFEDSKIRLSFSEKLLNFLEKMPKFAYPIQNLW
jgi:hypothetical protein